MTAGTQQIVSAFEQEGMTPEQIFDANDGEYDITAIKAVLMQFSSKYRKACKGEVKQLAAQLEEHGESVNTPDSEEVNLPVPLLNFNDAQLKRANEVIYNVMDDGDADPAIRLRAAIYVRDDKKGRLDMVSKIPAMQLNIGQFQLMIEKANRAIENTEAKREQMKKLETTPSEGDVVNGSMNSRTVELQPA